MVKRVRRPIRVRVDAEGSPSALFDGRRWRGVERVVDLWTEALPWWPGRETEEAGGRLAQAVEVTMYRLELAGGGLVEVERRPGEEGDESWWLYRVYD